MAEEKKLLEIENLRKYFPINGVKGPGVQAVQDVSLLTMDLITHCLTAEYIFVTFGV